MEVKKRERAPDGGWGWMVMYGSFLTLMILSSFSFFYSILFSDFLLSRGASSTTIASIFNLHVFLYNGTGLFTGPLTKEFGFRPVCNVGICIAAVSTLALVFVDSVWGLLVFFALAGVGAGLGTRPCYLLPAAYFDSRRGRANAIMMAGVCSGQFIGPPLVRYLLLEYCRKGATLMLCGIVLQCMVGAALFQPVEWHMKTNMAVRVENEELEGEKLHEVVLDAGGTDEMGTKEAEKLQMLMRVGGWRRPSEVSGPSLAVSDVDLFDIPPVRCHGSCSLENTTTKSSSVDNIVDESSGDVLRLLKALQRVLKAVCSDIKILRSPRALIIVLSGMLFSSAFFNFAMIAPFAIQGAGHSLSDAAWIMPLSGVSNLSARLIFSGLSDHPFFNIRFAYMAGCFIMCISNAVFGFLPSLTLMQAAMVVWGCGAGICATLAILIITYFMGLEKTSAVFGVQSLMISISVVTAGPLFGFIRDASGSYSATMLVMGCCSGLNALLWCFMPSAMAHDERKEAELRGKEEQEGLVDQLGVKVQSVE